MNEWNKFVLTNSKILQSKRFGCFTRDFDSVSFLVSHPKYYHTCNNSSITIVIFELIDLESNGTNITLLLWVGQPSVTGTTTITYWSINLIGGVISLSEATYQPLTFVYARAVSS